MSRETPAHIVERHETENEAAPRIKHVPHGVALALPRQACVIQPEEWDLCVSFVRSALHLSLSYLEQVRAEISLNNFSLLF